MGTWNVQFELLASWPMRTGGESLGRNFNRSSARRGAALLALGLLVAGGVACTAIDVTTDGTAPDAAPSSTGTAPIPTGTGTGTSALDAAPAPDARADAMTADATADAEADGASDAPTSDASDAATPDATPDAGAAIPVMPGADGVLRGTVGGSREQSWTGTLRLPNANCPASAQTINMGPISCCRFVGSFGAVSRVPVEFDLTTRAGTLAGAPIGPFAAAIVDPDGTLRFRQPTLLHAQTAWVAGVEMGRHMLAPASEVEESSKLLSLALVRPVSDSLRNMQVSWNPTTKAFRITMDLTMYQATPAGSCGLPSGDSSGRLNFDLR